MENGSCVQSCEIQRLEGGVGMQANAELGRISCTLSTVWTQLTAGSLKDVRYSVGRFCFLDLRYLAKTGAVNRRCPDNCLLASRMALPIVISMKLHAVQTVLLLR